MVDELVRHTGPAIATATDRRQAPLTLCRLLQTIAAPWRRTLRGWGRLPPGVVLALNLLMITAFWLAADLNFATGAKGHGINLSWRVAGLFYFTSCLVTALKASRRAEREEQSAPAKRRHIRGNTAVYKYSVALNMAGLMIIAVASVIHVSWVDWGVWTIIGLGTVVAVGLQGWRWNAVVAAWFGVLCRVVSQLAMAANFWLVGAPGFTIATLTLLWGLSLLRLLGVTVQARERPDCKDSQRLATFERWNAWSLAAVTLSWVAFHLVH